MSAFGRFLNVKIFLVFIALIRYHNIPVLSDQLYHITGHILHSKRYQTVELQRTFDRNVRTSCSSYDNHILRANDVPVVALLHSGIHMKFGEIFNACDKHGNELSEGLCNECQNGKSKRYLSQDVIDIYADNIISKDSLPIKSENAEINVLLAKIVVTLNLIGAEEALTLIDSSLKSWPSSPAMYYYRAVATMRIHPMNQVKMRDALADIKTVLEKTRHPNDELYSRRAEINLHLREYGKAIDDLNRVLFSNPSDKFYFLRGLLHLTLANYSSAESDFKQVKNSSSAWYIQSYYHLGLCLYYRGKLRNAIEVFKDVLKKDPYNMVASIAISQAYRELGNVVAASLRFNQTMALPNYKQSSTLMQLIGDMFFHTGDVEHALLYFKKCLFVDHSNMRCLYRMALSYASLGSYYRAVKYTTRVHACSIDYTQSSYVTPEFLKAHYLKENARYMHGHLDSSVMAVDMDKELEQYYKEGWARMSLLLSGFKEQPGIHPEIMPVSLLPFASFNTTTKMLICKAMKVGALTQINSDGFMPNRRISFTLGLAVVHISQFMAVVWKRMKENKPVESKTWAGVAHIAVQYLRLADLEQPILWIDNLSSKKTSKEFCLDFNLIRGSVVNFRTVQYLRILTSLISSTLEYKSGSDVQESLASIENESDEAKVCKTLLDVLKRTRHQNWFIVTTQITSSLDPKQKFDGAIVALTEDDSNSISLTINVRHTDERTKFYHSELKQTFKKFYDLRKADTSKILDIETLTKHVLTIAYYFSNLMPLTRGSSLVAYAVVIGLIMSHDYEISGKMPPGKLLDFEAMFSGSSESFVTNIREWMHIKKSSSILSLPFVWDVFPTVRSVLEVINIPPYVC